MYLAGAASLSVYPPPLPPPLVDGMPALGQAGGLRGASRGARPRTELPHLVHDEGGEARGSEAEDGEDGRVEEQRRGQPRAVRERALPALAARLAAATVRAR